MKQRREVREQIARRRASEADIKRSILSRTVPLTEYAELTGTPLAQVHKEIEAGTLPTRMVGNRRRIRLTREIADRMIAGLQRLSEELGVL